MPARGDRSARDSTRPRTNKRSPRSLFGATTMSHDVGVASLHPAACTGSGRTQRAISSGTAYLPGHRVMATPRLTARPSMARDRILTSSEPAASLRIVAASLFALLLCAGAAFARKPAVFDPIPYVDPFIGTGGHGHTYPGATVPFGMVQLSPDTRLEGWDGCSGYHDSDTLVFGFSHTHLSGTGVSDYGH